MIIYKADFRHAEVLVVELGLRNVNVLTSLIAKVNMGTDSEKLGGMSVTKCKPRVTRPNYSAVDRQNVQFAYEELSIAMSSPTTMDYEEHIWALFGGPAYIDRAAAAADGFRRFCGSLRRQPGGRQDDL